MHDSGFSYHSSNGYDLRYAFVLLTLCQHFFYVGTVFSPNSRPIIVDFVDLHLRIKDANFAEIMLFEWRNEH